MAIMHKALTKTLPHSCAISSSIQYLDRTEPREIQIDVKVVRVSKGKGLLSSSVLKELALCGKKHGIPVIGDPKRTSDYSIYQDFTLIKPNRKETETVVGFSLNNRNDFLRAAGKIKKEVY